MNREAWLEAVVRALRPRFKAAGYELPRMVRVSCGFPESHAFAHGDNRHDGVCFPPALTADGIPQIFISPVTSDSVRVASTLAHEVLHTAKPKGVDTHLYCHDRDFVVGMRAIGLEGRPSASHSGPELLAFLRAVVERIGPYPHARIRAPRKK